jgi:hypothetical protein
MTPEERELIVNLFSRLAQLEREPRDPEAERAIREGLSRAPNAVYALVQTTLLQDEALRAANQHITELEEAVRAQPQQNSSGGSFLGQRGASSGGGKWNTGQVLGGSVPSVPGPDRGQPMGAPPGYEREPAGNPWDRGSSGGPGGSYQGGPQGGPYQGGPGGPYQGGPGGPMSGGPGGPARGGGFLGTAAAVAAGAIGGGLLMGGIRSAMGGQSAGSGPFSGAFNQMGKPPGSGDPMSRDAGLGDINAKRPVSAKQDDEEDDDDNDDDDNDDDDDDDNDGDASDTDVDHDSFHDDDE